MWIYSLLLKMFTSIFEKLKCNWLNLLKLKFRIYLPCASLLFTHTKAATGPKNHSCHRINCWMVQNDFLMCKYELKFFYYKNTGLNQSIWILIFILFEDQRVRVKQTVMFPFTRSLPTPVPVGPVARWGRRLSTPAQPPTWLADTQLLQYYTALRVYISKKLESGAQPRCRHPKWHLVCPLDVFSMNTMVLVRNRVSLCPSGFYLSCCTMAVMTGEPALPHVI